jgi:hypothetical protein
MKLLLKLVLLLLIALFEIFPAQASLSSGNNGTFAEEGSYNYALTEANKCGANSFETQLNGINIASLYTARIVNVPDKPAVTIGVSETRDAAALFFKMYESYIKAAGDGEVNFTDLQYLVGPAMLLIPAFSGAPQILNELASLSDDQLKTLLLVADEYELGEHAQRAKQVFKTILTLAQTYFVFVNSQGQ